MTTEHSADQSADILRVVNAAASPTDLGEALAGSADLSAGAMAARRLIEWREQRGPYDDLAVVREVVDRYGPVRFDEIAPGLADLVRHVGLRVVGLVDPETTFSLLERVEGGVVRRRHDDLEIDRGGGSTGGVGYDDFEVELGLAGPAGFHEWISDTLADGPVRRSGAVHVTDREYRSVHVREFASAIITTVTFPACDAKSKEPASIRATFRPDAIRQHRGDLGTIKLSPAHSVWQESNFSVTVEGLPSAHVSRVDSFTWTQTIARDGSRVVEVPKIVLTLPVTELSSWEAWVLDAMISGEALSRSGTIIYLDEDLKDEVGRVELAGLVPISLKPPIGDANIEEIARFTIELLCQRLRFEPT